MTRLACSLLFGAALALAACGGDKDDGLGPPQRYPVPGCESFDTAPCDVLTSECQQRLYGLAACLRGSDPGDPPDVVVLSQADFQAQLEAEAAAEQPDPHLAQWESAFVLLGLTEPGGLQQMAEIASDVTFVWGLYDDNTKVVDVVDHGSDSTPETSSSVLLHEFVHALQDRESDLLTYEHVNYGTYDSALAADAVIEGEAQFQQERYLASMLGFDPASVDWDLLFQNGVDAAVHDIATSPTPITSAHDWFPYDFGARYIHLGWDATGHDGVLALFAAPPADTQLEMASVHDLATDVAAVSAIDGPMPPPQWTELGEDQLGALGVFELVSPSGQTDDEQAELSVALAWRADRLFLYGGTDVGHPSATALVWTCDFANEASASDMLSMLSTPVAAGATVDGTRLTVALANDGSDLWWVRGPASP